MSRSLLRPWLHGLTPVPHGGAAQLRREGIDVDGLTELSATILPGGPLPGVREALAAVDLAAYPDPHAWALRCTVAEHWGLAPEQVLPANGSVSLIRAVARAVLQPGERSPIVGPTFGEYAQAVRLAGGVPVEIDENTAPEGLLTWLCNPNNPTGALRDEHRWRRKGQLLVVDEAYLGFARPEPAPAVVPGVLRLRSWTKDRGLAGARLGFAIGEPDLLEVLAEMLDPWGVSALAQAAGIAVCQPEALEALDYRLTALHAERRWVLQALEEAGFSTVAGHAPFFLVEVADAAEARRLLLGHGLLVRDCTSFGLPQHIRVSPRDRDAHTRLVAALQAHRSTVTRY